MTEFNFSKDETYIELSKNTKALLSEEMEYFNDLALRKISDSSDIKKLQDMYNQMDRPFMILLCGEYNSGKSTFINALLKDEFCKIGATPTTDKINIIKNTEVEFTGMQDDFVNIVNSSNEFLKNFLIVDTPGTNSIVKEHQEITLSFAHQAELILFLTSADRPFSESERALLDLISKQYGKKVVFILNKIDQKIEEEIQEITEFIEDNAFKYLGFKPSVLKMSAKMAMTGIKENNMSLIEASRLNNMMEEINNIYKTNAMYLKLNSPLTIALALLNSVKDQIYLDYNSIQGEVLDLENFFKNIEQYKKDLENDYSKKTNILNSQFAEIENSMYKVIDDVTFGKVFKSKIPFIKDKIEYDFEGDFTELAKKINAILEDLIYDSVKDNRQFLGQAEIFTEKQMKKYQRPDMMIQTGSSDFMERGKEILDTLKKSFENEYDRLDLNDESANIKKAIDDGFAGSVIGSVASIGAGAVFVCCLPEIMMAIVGGSIAVVLTISSFLILPQKKKKAKKLLTKKFTELAANLYNISFEKIKENINSTHERIERNFKPYRSFINSQKAIVEANKDKTEVLLKRADEIKTAVDLKYK